MTKQELDDRILNSSIVFRISDVGKIMDANGNYLQYNSDEQYSGNIILPKGAKVVRVEFDNKGDNCRIFAYWRGKYREGYLSSRVMVDFDGFTSDSTEIFKNECRAYYLL